MVATCSVQLVYAVAGLIVNPDFAVGSDATAEKLLWVDFNGWHALSGILLFALGIGAGLYHDTTAEVWSWGAAASLVATSIWALIDPLVAGLWYLPNTTSDVVYHLLGALVALAPLVPRVVDRLSRAG